MSNFKGRNGLDAYIQVSQKVTYAALDTELTEPALFKLITSAPSGNVGVVFADGSTGVIDCERLDGMNALVKKITTANTTINLSDFGLFR